MVKPIQRNEIQGFSKGLITDLNPLNSQIDTTVNEKNFILKVDGTRDRRLGFNQEQFGQSYNTGVSWNQLKLSSISSYLWINAAGDSRNRFVVVQIGYMIYFFRIGGGMRGETTLEGSLQVPITENATFSYSHVEGYLGIVNGTPNIGLIEYNPITSTFTYSTFRLKIRDLFGIQETIEPRYEDDKSFKWMLNWQHYYNLYNQGWAIPRRDWQFGDPPLLDAVYLGSNKYSPANAPSNADIVWTGMSKKPLTETSIESFDAFHYKQFESVIGSDTKAAKGFFIIDAFNRGSSRSDAWVNHKNKYPQTGNLVTGFNPPQDGTSGGPTSLAAHAGRLFFSGCKGSVVDGDLRSPNYNNYVFFTQLIRNKADFSKCYQEGDPTSQASNDIVDTDGGFISISEAINIHTMYSMGERLFLIAENGVWSIAGGSNYGFSATNYKVDKLSTYGGIPNKSFVEYGGEGFFWGWDGIYMISKNQFGDYDVKNVTKDTINNHYRSISDQAKVTCQGFVDKANRQIRWVYTDGTLFESGVSKELVLDVKFQAFTLVEISKHPNNSAYVLTGIQAGDFSTRYALGNVLVGNDDVKAGNLNVMSTSSNNVALDSNVKYLTVFDFNSNLNMCMCEYNNPDYEDWEFTGYPVDADAFMETNAFTGGDMSINKQVPYITMAFAETERRMTATGADREGSCLGRFMWNFSHLSRSGKWSREQQLYRKSRFFYGDLDIDNGFSILTTKTKIRGIGKSLAFRVETEPRKSCHIYGWNISLTNNQT